MLDKLLREPLAKLMRPLSRAISRTGLKPNTVTVMGTVVMAVGSYLVVRGTLVPAGWVLFAGALFDVVDGSMAKSAGEPSKLGAFLDSTTDRLADGMIFSALAWHFATGCQTFVRTGPRSGFIPDFCSHYFSLPGLALTLAAAMLAFLTSYMRARAEGLGLEGKAGIAERPERMTLIIAGLVLGPLVPALIILVALSAVTVVQRFVSVWNQAKSATPL